MAAIFSRKQRATSNPHVRMPHSSTTMPTPTASAAAAASQAFMKNQQSNATLSAAAAATALRSHPSTPVEVGDIQTKRMARKGSTSSTGSGPSAGRPSSQLQRRGSAGSMTERTFRSPSPGRAVSPSRKVAAVSPDVPPMPTIPAEIPAIPPKSHKRAASMENQARISSPLPRTGGRGVSLDRANPPASAGLGPSPLSKITELDREGSQRSSVNFSRPMSPSNAPAFGAQIRPKSQGGWFSGPTVTHAKPRSTPFEHLDRPKTAIGITPADVSSIQQAVQGVADRPVTPKKKKKRFPGVEGSRLAAGTMHVKPTGTAVSSDEPAKPPPAQAAETPAIRAAVPSPGSTSADDRSPIDSSSEASPIGRQIKAAGVLAKQPSVVREEPELEKQSEDTPSANTGRKIDASMIRSPTDTARPASFALLSTAQPTATQQRSQRSASDDLGRTDSMQMAVPGRQVRETSLSPSRTPHFSLVPSDLESGKKHQPPPRSVSPVKSAMKHSPSSSVRTASPVANPPAGRGASASPSRSQSPTQKKAARVSFDEGPATIIPGLESSKHAPPNTKTKLVEEPEFEEIYTPRPALPSFGSIRGRKRVEEEPVPPLKPPEEAPETEPSSLSSSRTLVDPSSTKDHGHSKDHAIGGILAQDFANKGKERARSPEPEVERPQGSDSLPLPPEVTSVEGSGYISDSDASAYDESIPATPKRAESGPTATARPISPEQKEIIAAIEPPVSSEAQTAQPEPDPSEQSEPKVVPEISVHPATPGAEAEEKTYTIPGAFPSAWESSLEVDKQGLPEQDITASEDSPKTALSHSITAVPPASIASPSLQLLTKELDDSESENESVYSDAPEDPSELFTSIDAVLGSPTSPPGLALSTDRPTPSGSAQVSPIQRTRERDDKVVPTAAAWDDATNYWRGLSDTKRREIEEQAATKEVAEESEDEPVAVERPPTPPKPKKRKKKAVPAGTAGPSQPEPVVTPATHQAQAPQEPRQPILKKSMRPEHVRSFSEEGPHGMPTTLRSPKKGLESSRYAPQNEPRGALQKKNILSTRPATSAGLKTTAPASPTLTKAPIPPSMQLRRTSSADSDSSFKRARKPAITTGDDARVSLRRTMRQPPPMQTAPPKATRTTLRAQPEPASPPPRQMRMSLRQSVESEPPSFRAQAPQKKTKKRSALSPTRLRGLGRAGRDKARAVVAATPAIPAGVAQKFRSRFAGDSDDEGEPLERGPRTAQTRFADSDDEEDLAPVRGIPRKEDDVASELLPGEEDSDGDEVERPPMPSEKEMEAATRLARERLAERGVIDAKKGGGEGDALAVGTLRGKKTADVDGGEKTGLEASKYAPKAGEVTFKEPATQRKRWSLFSIGKDKKRASSLPPQFPDTGESSSPRSQTAHEHKLQRRGTPTDLPELGEEESWPLPAPLKDGAGVDDERPHTSDGVTTGTGSVVRFEDRPDMGKRRSTADELATVEDVGGIRRRLSKVEPVVSQRTGKVKRFGRLRRAFGLRD